MSPWRGSSRRHKVLVAVLIMAAALFIVALAMIIGLIITGPESSATVTHCASRPAACGYPAASNTGVPPGVTLRRVPEQVRSGPGWHFDPRGWVEVDGNGAVLSGLSIRGGLDIRASGVTVKDVRVTGDGPGPYGVSLRHAGDVTIEDSSIQAASTSAERVTTGVKDIYGDAAGTVLLRDDIAGYESGVQINQGLVQDSYIHNETVVPGNHANGITVTGGTALLTINHNTIFDSFGQAAAVGLYPDNGTQARRTITGNLLAGGAYTIYAGQGPRGPATSGIVIAGNRISTAYFPRGGARGPVTNFDPSGTGNVWQANFWDDSGRTIPSP